MSETHDWDYVRASFQKIWGYDEFRPPQGEIVRCLLAQQDALIIMPTGGGKSICFQLPALLQTGLTIVVSPLVALMENQVQELHERHLSAAVIHGELPAHQRRQTLLALEKQKLRLLYVSPETLLSPPVWERLCQPDLKINGLILDEAHCLVQWGETFRPAYYRLGAVRPALLQAKPAGTRIAIAAFTATANPQAQQTIQRILQLSQPQVFHLSPLRTNLALSVRIAWTPRQRRQQTLKFIQARPGQAGLIYVRTRRDSETLAEWLTQQKLPTVAYHAGLSPGERRSIETDWISDKTQFVVCTCAFGMGINKPNVRWVVHFHAPSLLSEYVQEVGRAGRDGKPSQALTLISEPTGWLDPEDQQRRKFFEEKVRSQQQVAQQLAGKLPRAGEVTAVSRQFRDGAIALSLLHGAGKLHWQDPFNYVMQATPADQSGRSLASMTQNTGAAQQMTQYLQCRECRWQFLLRAFGFTKEAQGLRCGQCDNCRKQK